MGLGLTIKRTMYTFFIDFLKTWAYYRLTMKNKKPKLYFYVHADGSASVFRVFRAYTKEDIRKHLNVTKYKITLYCWEESSLNIVLYHDEVSIVDLTV